MTPSHSRPLFRTVFVTLWVLILAGIFYWNSLMQAKIHSLQDEQLDVLDALQKVNAANQTYRMLLERQHANLKECMAQLPPLEVEEFYKRHLEELQKQMKKPPQKKPR